MRAARFCSSVWGATRLQPRGLRRAREAAHSRASWEGERGLRSVPSISVGIRTLGEELSGPARRRRGRRDGWFLLVAYRHASTPPQPKPFHTSVRPVGVGVLSSFYCFCAAGSALDASRRETGPGAPTALPTGSVSFGRCRRGAAEPYWSGVGRPLR